MQCNICDGTKFLDFNGRVGIMCVSCKSVERTRLVWMYIERLGLHRDSRILHLAPERGIYDKLTKLVAPGNYDVRDIDPAKYPFAKGIRPLDLCKLEALESNSYDLILHVHVLEHVPCNIAYPLYHLHRALKPGGTHLFLVPFMGGKYDECFQDIGDAERRRRFGQEDHVRRFGVVDVAEHLGKLVELNAKFDAEADLGAALLERYNVPRNAWKGLSPHTPISLKKDQMLFLAS